MNTGIFITGTDTGVGKTMVACLIITYLKKHGIDVGVMKPIETGCLKTYNKLIPQDARLLKTISNTLDSISLVNPYRFKFPLAPLVTADIEGKDIDFDKIRNAFNEIKKNHPYIIVEGAGGLLVPIARQNLKHKQRVLYMADLAKYLRLPILIIIGNRLGALNHAILTVRHANSIGLKILGIILCNLKPEGMAEKTNATVLEELLNSKILFKIPYLPELIYRKKNPSLFLNMVNKINFSFPLHPFLTIP